MMRSRGSWSRLSLLLGVLAATPAAAATFPCEASPNCTDDAATQCTIFASRADGVHDYYYYRLPDAYDPDQTYPLLFWFHAMGQASTSPSPNDDCVISVPNVMVEMANGSASGLGAKDMIVFGLAQRGTQDYLGDFCYQSCPTLAADDQEAKADMLELLNQLVSRFHINYVVTGGSSMGGYVALRLAQLAPDKVHVVFSSAPALHRQRESATDSGGQNGPGSVIIEQAFADGEFDERLVFDVIGLADENQLDIVSASQALNDTMSGKPWWRFAQEQGIPHVNHFSDDYLCPSSGGFRDPSSKWPPLCDEASGRKPFLQNVAYGCQHPTEASCGFDADPFTTGRLWDDVRAWEAAHPEVAQGELQPTAGWQVPDADGWYLESALFAHGGKEPGSTPAPGPDAGVAAHDAQSGAQADTGTWIDDAGQVHGGDAAGGGGGLADRSGTCGCHAGDAGGNGAALLVGLGAAAAVARRRRRGARA